MAYYRLSFKIITVPDPASPFNRRWQWFKQIVQAPNHGQACARGREIAEEHTVVFVDAVRLLKVVGIVEARDFPGFTEI